MTLLRTRGGAFGAEVDSRRVFRKPDPTGDEGIALVAVLGLMLVAAVVSVAILGVTLNALAYTTGVKNDVRSTAAAQAGVDAAYAAINNSSPAALPCAVATSTLPNATYSATISWYSGSVLQTCVGGVLAVTATTNLTALVTSTGNATSSALRSATFGDASTSRATFAVTATIAVATSALSDVIYSGGGLTLPNNVTLAQSATGAQDASVYTPGSLSCNTSSSIQGNVIAQGSVAIPNTCALTGYVWSGGSVSVSSSSAKIGGDVYAAGSVTVGPGHVGGAVVAQGPVSVASGGQSSCSGLSGTWSICGSIYSLGGGITYANGANNGGSAYASGSIDLGTANSTTIVNKDLVSTGGSLTASNASGTTVGNTVKVDGTVTGLTTARVGASSTSCQFGATTPFTQCGSAPTIPSTGNPADAFPSTLGYPATTGGALVNAPAVQSMPSITNDAAGLAKWTAAGWTVINVNNPATVVSDLLNGLGAIVTGSKVLLNISASSCTGLNGPVSYDGSSLFNSTLSVDRDTAIMSPCGFSFTNSAKASTFLGIQHQLQLIVPSNSTLGGDIVANNLTTSNLNTLLYTPNDITLTNALTGFSGQIYGGTVSGPTSASTITMHSMIVPGVAATSTSTAASVVATPSSRAGS
jgi:hypothetical protein